MREVACVIDLTSNCVHRFKLLVSTYGLTGVTARQKYENDEIYCGKTVDFAGYMITA